MDRREVQGQARQRARLSRLLFLKLALQQIDLVGQRDILGDQRLDLAHRVQHRGVVATAKPASDFRQ